MTIAAGFKCSDGFVLCADTEITYADLYKESRAKLRASRLPNCNLYWAICGNVDFVNMLMGKIVEAVEDCSNDMQEIRAEIERVYIEVSNNYINHPQPEIPLLIHKPKTTNIKFVKLSGSIISPVSDWVCVGTGQPLASYLIGDMYRRDMPMWDVGTLAAYALTHVKRHAFGCGGTSQILMIANDGKVKLFMTKGPGERNPEQEDFERYIVDIDSAVKSFVASVITSDLTSGRVDQQIKLLNQRLAEAATKRLEWLDAERDAMFEAVIEQVDLPESGEEQKS